LLKKGVNAQVQSFQNKKICRIKLSRVLGHSVKESALIRWNYRKCTVQCSSIQRHTCTKNVYKKE